MTKTVWHNITISDTLTYPVARELKSSKKLKAGVILGQF